MASKAPNRHKRKKAPAPTRVSVVGQASVPSLNHEVEAAPPETAVHRYALVRERLAERRKELGMSMSALARAIGVSPSMISQIERGQTLPSVETLFALAHALGAAVDTFFEDGPAPHAAAAAAQHPDGNAAAGDGSSLVPRAERATIRIQGGIRWERLTPRAMENFEFLELVYEPGAQSSEHLYPHPGYEMVLVLSGCFEIQVGFEHYVLNPGDSIAFDSSRPHRYVNPLQEESRAVTTIIHLPTASALEPAAVSDRAVRRGHP